MQPEAKRFNYNPVAVSLIILAAIGNFATEEPSCGDVELGADDTHIGPDQVAAVRSAHPGVEMFVYEGAEHGLNCDARASYKAASAGLAWTRTLDFLKVHIT